MLLGDEGAGIHIIRRLKDLELPPTVELLDGATGGFSLIPVFEKHKDDKFIIIDALKIQYEDGSDTASTAGGKKGDLYLIPLEELYRSIDSNYENPEFISFHQTALSDVLLLMLRTFKIRIKGYLLGINIFNPDGKNGDTDLEYSMELSPEIEEKIGRAVEIIKKHI